MSVNTKISRTKHFLGHCLDNTFSLDGCYGRISQKCHNDVTSQELKESSLILLTIALAGGIHGLDQNMDPRQ